MMGLYSCRFLQATIGIQFHAGTTSPGYPNDQNVIENNTLLNNGINIPYRSEYRQKVVNNTVDGKKVYYLHDVHGTEDNPVVIENDAATVFLHDCSYIEVRNNTLNDGITGIDVSNSNHISIHDNDIGRNKWSGIFICSSDISVFDNQIYDNMNGVHLETYYTECRNIAIFDNEIFGNSEYGVRWGGSDYNIDASGNWWGDESGPYHPERNPSGKGDSVSNHVDFEPWLMEDGKTQNVGGKSDGEESIILPVIIVTIGTTGLLAAAFYRNDLRIVFYSALLHPLYTKLGKDIILDQSCRQRIFSCISQNPGANYSHLKRELNLGTGTLVYHLSVLEREGYIRTGKTMGRRTYVPRDADHNPEMIPTADLSPNQQAIHDLLKEQGPATRISIETTLSISRQTVYYNINRLIMRGLVESSGRGRNSLCKLKDQT